MAEAMVTKHYMGQGRSIAEVLRNVKAQNPLPVIDDAWTAHEYFANSCMGPGVMSSAGYSLWPNSYVVP